MQIAISDTIKLTEFRPSDKAAIVERISDRAIYDVTLRIPYPYTEAHFDQWLAIVTQSAETFGGPTHFAIRENDSAIGAIGFHNLIPNHRTEFGYWLAKPWWGRGIMTAAIGRACEYALGRWQLVRIAAHVFDGNVASARVLEKNQFQFEGLLRKYFCKDGRFIDCLAYALVR